MYIDMNKQYYSMLLSICTGFITVYWVQFICVFSENASYLHVPYLFFCYDGIFCLMCMTYILTVHYTVYGVHYTVYGVHNIFCGNDELQQIRDAVIHCTQYSVYLTVYSI